MTRSTQSGDDIQATIAFAGDTMFGGAFTERLRESGGEFDEVFQSFQSIYGDYDRFCLNLEAPLTTNGKKNRQRAPQLSSPPESVAALQALGCDIVSLNNNHILDYHSQGFEQTLTHLAASDIQYFGAGETQAVAKAPLQVDVNGVEITFIGYTTDAPNVDAPLATEEPVGGAPIDREQICSDIQSLRVGTDIVCVVFHWGHEHIRYPSPDQIATARAVIDAGADLVVGHHPHIVQGYEQYGGGLIFYSLGNFLFSDYYRVDGRLAKWDDENQFGLCPQVSFNADGLTSVDLMVTKQTETGVTVVDPTVLPFDLNDLCNQIELSDEYERFWSTQKARRERQLERRRLRRRVTELGFRGLLQRISMERLRRVGSLALDSIRGRSR